MNAWTDGHWISPDGLRLHYRDYPGPPDRPPILCIPGLTRNARDFEGVAARLADKWRVICVDLRGRGDSQHARDPLTYIPSVYLQDLKALFDALRLDRIVIFGTSLGGLLAMLLAVSDRGRLAGVLMNDVGPVLESRGLERIRNYIGRAQSWPTWLHAARAFAEMQGAVYPSWQIEQWIAHAKRLCRLNPNGRIILDYDQRIAEPFKTPPAKETDLWPAFDALQSAPLLLVRGALSDLLSEHTAERMIARHQDADYAVVPGVGHAPTLDEPEAAAAIDRFLDRVDRRSSSHA